MSTPIRVLVNGAAGKMGVEAVKAIDAAPDLTLVARTGRGDDLLRVINDAKPQVVVDLTTAAVAFDNALLIVRAGVRPVIGTSGLMAEQVQLLQQLCAEKKLGGLVAPNFSIGAVLALQYEQHCARYFPSVEIIEMHHQKKADAPSGTAIRSAELIAQARQEAPLHNAAAKEILAGARGAMHEDVPIHSVRLPGLLAHQIVMFGSPGETLSICHDVISREAYMPGLCLGCRKVMALDTLVYGLEHLL